MSSLNGIEANMANLESWVIRHLGEGACDDGSYTSYSELTKGPTHNVIAYGTSSFSPPPSISLTPSSTPSLLRHESSHSALDLLTPEDSMV
jgi:hypothetical protein